MSDPLSYLSEQLEAWKQAGTYQRLRVLESRVRAGRACGRREVINLASNNYLGLADHPKLIEAAVERGQKYGAGSGAVRTISGTMTLHMELEERIAAFKNVEACVVFQSGFAANAGTVSAILTPEDHIISDALNHASIIDGCRLSKAKIHVFPHKDTAAAAKILAELDGAPGRKLLITDGVFSMDGDIGPLPGTGGTRGAHGAIMMVDDAHSSGVLGRNGRGTVDHFGLHGRVRYSGGHALESDRRAGRVCVRQPRPDRVSVSPRAAVPVLDLASAGGGGGLPGGVRHSRRASRSGSRQLWENTRYFKAALSAAGFDTGASETPITPVMVGEAETAHAFSRALFDEGVFATGIGFPTVPEGKARIRTIVTATHTRAELDRALEVFERVGKKLGILAG